MDADIKRLLEAPFDGSGLVSRDTLIRTILLIAQEQHAYAIERVTVSAGVVALTLPAGSTQAVVALRSMAEKMLDSFDQSGFALTGANRVVVSPTGGTLAGESGNDLMIGSDTVDGLIGDAGNDELIAGGGDDILLGGGGTDALFGGTGNDYLDGGAGPDYLYGGIGADIYNFTGAFGGDWVVDSDGQGTINVDGVILTGGKKVSTGSYRDSVTGWSYTIADAGLILRKDGSLNQITVRGWQSGQLGITLDETVTAPVTTNSYAGDFIKNTNVAGTAYTTSNGNYESAGAQANANDAITGSTAADSMLGLGVLISIQK